MLGLKQIFTWWHKQTFGTFLKTLFFGKLVGKDEYGNKYYKYWANQKKISIYQPKLDIFKYFKIKNYWIDCFCEKNNFTIIDCTLFE